MSRLRLKWGLLKVFNIMADDLAKEVEDWKDSNQFNEAIKQTEDFEEKFAAEFVKQLNKVKNKSGFILDIVLKVTNRWGSVESEEKL